MKFLNWPFFLLGLTASCALGCSASGPNDNMIGSEGGVVLGPDGVVAEFPTGAVSEPIEVEIVKVAGKPKGVRTLSPVYEFKPSNITFDQYVRVTIPYKAGAYGDETQIYLAWADALDGEWERRESQVNTQGRLVHGSVTHFSFGVLAVATEE